MRGLICACVLAVLLCPWNTSTAASMSRHSPKVQVYTHKPGEPGVANTLLCHVNNFYPPLIDVELHHNGVAMPGSNVTELIFTEKWQYQVTRSAHFTPNAADTYTCRVQHDGNITFQVLELDM